MTEQHPQAAAPSCANTGADPDWEADAAAASLNERMLRMTFDAYCRPSLPRQLKALVALMEAGVLATSQVMEILRAVVAEKADR